MTTEAMQTETGATTTEAQGASSQADQQSATGADNGGQQQQAEGQGADATQGKGGEPDGDKDKGKPEGAPEKYEFKAPEGQEFSEPVIGAFSEVAKELNLPQDAAQKILDKMAPVIWQNQSAQVEAIQNGWLEAAKADKEFGGDKLEENMAVANKTFDRFGTPELKALLETTRLGNHPELIRWAHRVGKALSEDTHVLGTTSSKLDRDARSLYANSNMNP